MHKTVELFERADREGHPMASYDIGLLYEDGVDGIIAKNEQRAFDFIKIAAEKGVVDAKYSLSVYYDQDYSNAIVAPDRKKHIKLLKESAKKGYPQAQFDLARIYESGSNGVPKNPKQAFKLFKQAAEHEDNANAQCALATYYSEGLVTDRNEQLAVEWCEKAVKQGHELAKYNQAKYRIERYTILMRICQQNRKKKLFFVWRLQPMKIMMSMPWSY